MSEYYLTNKKDAYCGVSFETLEDGFINVKYDINGVDLWETNWENMGKMLQTLDGWEEEAFYVVNKADGKNWEINIGSIRYTDEDIFLGCYGNDGPSIDLGRLAECYDDCETCDRCHNTDSYYDDEEDCYVAPSCRDCEGCSEHPCIRTNGRLALEKALEGAENRSANSKGEQ